MDGDTLQSIAFDAAHRWQAVEQVHPFGPEWEVFKVEGKVFMLATETTGEPIVILKCEPEHSVALRQETDVITPGYHMNKRHWITIHPRQGVAKDLIEDLVRNSYELVVEGLPRARRPLGWAVEDRSRPSR